VRFEPSELRPRAQSSRFGNPARAATNSPPRSAHQSDDGCESDGASQGGKENQGRDVPELPFANGGLDQGGEDQAGAEGIEDGPGDGFDLYFQRPLEGIAQADGDENGYNVVVKYSWQSLHHSLTYFGRAQYRSGRSSKGMSRKPCMNSSCSKASSTTSRRNWSPPW